MLPAVRPSDGHAKGLARPKASGTALSVQRHESLECGNLHPKFVLEPGKVVVRPLCGRFLGEDRGDGADPLGVGLGCIPRERKHEGPYCRVENFAVQRGSLPTDREAGLLRCIAQKLRQKFFSELGIRPLNSTIAAPRRSA